MLINFFMNVKRKDETLLAFCGIFALFAGILNGFIGVGGGVLIIFILKLIFKNNKKSAFAYAPAVILPMTALSAAIYCIREPDILTGSLPLLPMSMAGGAFGAYLVDKINGRAVSFIFSVLTIFAGIMAVIK